MLGRHAKEAQAQRITNGGPNDILVGTCISCGKSVEVERWQASESTDEFLGEPMVECKSPVNLKRGICGARIYLRMKPEEFK